ncbi:DUF4391 domain-containing protein [Gimesia sp.]|uniref:DUF4391 domain-containing protein n=1 Tax=Gimesia sp. TaxID=2024833 RepID=UPI003A92CEA8
MFLYPKQAAFGKVLPKSKIYQHARPTRRVQKLFVDQVSRIIWHYKLSPETVNLPSRPGVPEIHIFTIELKAGKLDEAVLRCIDKAIIFPIFYELVFEDRVREMAAFKRPSDAYSSKWVVGDYFDTEWQPRDELRGPLPVSLDLAGLYEQMLRRLMPFPARDGESLKAQVERLATARTKENQCCKLEARLEREKQFNRKVELNAELRAVKNELDALLS